MSAPRPMGEQVLEALRLRASAKEDDFDFSRTVEPAKIEAILEAGRWAPSSRNLQPWLFHAVTDQALRSRMNALAGHDGNRWIFDCPVNVVVSVGPTEYIRDAGDPRLWFDAGLACENMLLAANALGLACCPTGGWDEAGLKVALGLPEQRMAVCMICLGYPALFHPDGHPKWTGRARNRKPLPEVAPPVRVPGRS